MFKGNDDVFVNTHHLLNYLNSLSRNKAKDLFIGDVIHNAGPHRDKKLKYYIPEVADTGMYPPYIGGGGFLYSSHLALRLYNVTDRVLLYPSMMFILECAFRNLALLQRDTKASGHLI